MTKSFKKYIWILIALAAIGGIIVLARQGSNNSAPTQNLTPEQSISHGHGLAVDVADPNKLWIATHYGLLLLQDEKDLYRVGKSRDDYMGFSVHPTDPNVFFTSGHPSFGSNLGFQKSEDGGVTWKKISIGVNGPVDFHAMAVSPVNSDIIYGWYAGNLQLSEDQGRNWRIVNREVAPIQFAADSENENRVYAATRNGVLVSNDRGITWTILSQELVSGAVSVIAVHPKDSQILLIFSEALKGLGKSVDGGQTWSQIDERFNNETVLYIALSRIDPSVVYVLTHGNKLFKSNNAGDSWVRVQIR